MSLNKVRDFKSKSQIDLSYEKIEELVKNLFGNREKLISATVTSEGDVNSCYILKTSSVEELMFLKVENEFIPKFYNGQVAKEVAASNLLGQYNIPTAKVLAHEIVKKKFEHRFILMEFIEGNILSRVWNSLDKEQKVDVKTSCVHLIEKFKKIPSDFFGDIYDDGHFGKHFNWKSAFKSISEVAVKDCENMESLSKNDASLVRDAITKCSDTLRNYKDACFNHMDLHWNNIIVIQGPNGNVSFRAVLDFGSSIFGPSFSDEIRINKGFFYMTEDFYDDKFKISEKITPEEIFSSELLSFLDYFVFLTLIGDYENEKANLLGMCKTFLGHP